MNIKVVSDAISINDLKKIGKEFYRSMIKGAVDVESDAVAFGGEYHIDAANVLAERGSPRKNIWGFNVHFDKPRDSWIEYTALINIRPDAGNREMEIQDAALRDRIGHIVNSKII